MSKCQLTNLQKIYNAAIIKQIDRELFSVEYPGLILLIAINHLLAFYVHGKWHCYIGKNKKQVTKYKNEIKTMYSIDRWHESHKAMQNELSRLIKKTTYGKNNKRI